MTEHSEPDERIIQIATCPPGWRAAFRGGVLGVEITQPIAALGLRKDGRVVPMVLSDNGDFFESALKHRNFDVVLTPDDTDEENGGEEGDSAGSQRV